eukprot:6419007-Karenia_brevis.AAC.1
MPANPGAATRLVFVLLRFLLMCITPGGVTRTNVLCKSPLHPGGGWMEAYPVIVIPAGDENN